MYRIIIISVLRTKLNESIHPTLHVLFLFLLSSPLSGLGARDGESGAVLLCCWSDVTTGCDVTAEDEETSDVIAGPATGVVLSEGGPSGECGPQRGTGSGLWQFLQVSTSGRDVSYFLHPTPRYTLFLITPTTRKQLYA